MNKSFCFFYVCSSARAQASSISLCNIFPSLSFFSDHLVVASFYMLLFSGSPETIRLRQMFFYQQKKQKTFSLQDFITFEFLWFHSSWTLCDFDYLTWGLWSRWDLTANFSWSSKPNKIQKTGLTMKRNYLCLIRRFNQNEIRTKSERRS